MVPEPVEGLNLPQVCVGWHARAERALLSGARERRHSVADGREAGTRRARSGRREAERPRETMLAEGRGGAVVSTGSTSLGSVQDDMHERREPGCRKRGCGDGGNRRRPLGRLLPNPSLAHTQANKKPGVSPGFSFAVTVGFEPTVAINYTAFRVLHLRPLGHVTLLAARPAGQAYPLPPSSHNAPTSRGRRAQHAPDVLSLTTSECGKKRYRPRVRSWITK